MPKEKVLIIVESPKKISTIQKYLPKENDYIVLASQGHIADLSVAGKYRMGIDIDNNFSLHYITMPDKKERLQAIINAATTCNKVLIATDGDREGECIGSLIKERIRTCKKPIKRIIFEEITKSGIEKGLNNERELNENLANAAKARRALDRIVGFMGSPFTIKQLGKNMSAGRVQSVALKLVVEREKVIKEFKPEEYWVIKANLMKFAKEEFVATLFTKENISNKEEADIIKNELMDAAYKVSKVVAKPKKRNPFPPLNTAKLQMVASTRFKLSPSKTMAAAQELYEQGHITYMRTDSVRISDEAVAMVRGWIQQKYPNCLPAKPNFYKNKDDAQNAHEAIRPSDVNLLPKERPQTNPEKVYRVIWDAFVTSQMSPAVYDTTSVIIMTDTNKELRANGRVLKEPGWLVLNSNFDDNEDAESKLPILIVNDVLTLIEPKVIAEQKFTQAPPRFKSPTLIQELEANGIGRPSTYAAIMQKICETRGFVEEKNNILYPTEAGTSVVDLLDKYFTFMKYDFTADMEKKLDDIEHGKINYIDTMSTFYKPFKNELVKAYEDNQIEDNLEHTCKLCGSKMVVKKSSGGFFLGCSTYPKCKYTINCNMVDNKIVINRIKDKILPEEVKCPMCDGRMKEKIGKFGPYYSCVNYPNCKGTRKKPFGKKCPNCGLDLYKTIFDKEPYKGFVLCCVGYPNCKYIEKLIEDKE